MAADNKCLLGHLSVRDAFIRFLKDAHAFDEWKSAVDGESHATIILDSIDNGMEAVESLLIDGYAFWYADDSFPWAELSKKWRDTIHDAGWVA